MPLHIVKLCVGAESVEDLSAWQSGRLEAEGRVVHTTFQRPRRAEEVLDGGSLYWVVKGIIQVRQRIIGFDEGTKEDGSRCCLFVLDPALVLVKGKRRRPFQGWRYLKPEAVPPDMAGTASKGAQEMPLKMRRELSELGLL